MPLEQTRPQPPRPPPTNSYHSGASQWIGRYGQGDGNPSTITSASPSTVAPAAGAVQGPAQIQNRAGHMMTNIPPPMPPYSGQSTSIASSPARNGHMPPPRSIPQIPLIPPIPQQSQPRPAHSFHNPQPPLHSRNLPPSVAPNNGVTASAASIPTQHGPRPPNSQLRPPPDRAGVKESRTGPVNSTLSAKALTRAPTSASTAWPSSRQHTAPSYSDMDVDELANTDDDDPVPLIISDLDPRFGKTDVKLPKPSPSSRPTVNASLRPPTSQTPRETAPLSISLRAAAPTTTATYSAKPLGTSSPQRQPIVSIALARPLTSPSHAHRPPPHPQYLTTASKSPAAAASVSVSIPSYSTKDSATGKTNDSIGNHQLPTLWPPMPQTKSPGGSVGRRTNHLIGAAPSAASSLPQVQIKGGRPKGWKPGMSYREVALRNLGVDTSDPTLPADFVMGRRDRRALGKPDRRPAGRPRLHGSNSSVSADVDAGAKKPLGRPRLHKTAKDRIMYGKRIGRPPLRTVEEVQRTIFHESTVRFVPFKCEWAGCRAELHNLATLRRHVDFVHGRGGRVGQAGQAGQAASTTGPATCLWRKCATREPPIQFRPDHGKDDNDTSLRTFLEHMEHYHLEPLSWHQGDGFANSNHLGPPPTPASIVLAEKEADLHQNRSAAITEDEDAEQYRNCATTAALDMAIRVPAKYVPGYLLEGGRQVTPLLRDPILQVSSAFWSADEWARHIKEAYRQQHRRPERGWTG